MAGPAVIGALRVVLGADTAAFEDGMKKASNGLAGFAKQAGTIAAGIQLQKAIEGMTRALVSWVKEAIVGADQLGKLAQSIGIPVDELSRLKHAADLSGISVEELGKGVGRLSKAMSDTAAGGTGPAADAFRALGITVTNADGSLRKSTEVMADISDRFGRMEDGAGKTALAIAIFGRAGADLIPMLNQGGSALRRMMEEADRLGIVITEKTAKSAEAFNDNLTRLGKVKDGIINKIIGGGGMIQALEALSTALVSASNNSTLLEKIQSGLAALLPRVVEWAIRTASAVRVLGNEMIGLADTLALVGRGKLFDAWEKFKETGRESTKIWGEMRAALAIFTAALDPAKNAMTNLDVATKKMLGGLVVLNQEALKTSAPVIQTGDAVKKMNDEMTAWSANMMASGTSVWESVRTPLEQYEAELERLGNLLNIRAIDQETFARAAEKAAQTLADSYGAAAQAIVTPMADAFKTLSTMNSKYAGIAKTAAIGEALVNTYLAATKALASLPPPFNFAAAAAVTAAGLVNVAKIKAQEFATGGSFRVGGSGGMDSQMVAFRATPGEMVDVRKPGQGSASEITVNMRGRDLFSRDMIRDLFGALNEASRDGYRLKLAEV